MSAIWGGSRLTRSSSASLRDQATQYYSDGRERAMEWEQSLEDYVKQQPLKAILMAAGAGLLLGIIWKRR